MSKPMWPSGPDTWHRRDDAEADERQERSRTPSPEGEDVEALARKMFATEDTPAKWESLTDRGREPYLRMARVALRFLASTPTQEAALPCVRCLTDCRDPDSDDGMLDGACQINDGRWTCSRECWERVVAMWDDSTREAERGEGEATTVTCSTCGKSVSNSVVPAGGTLVVRAYVECPECLARTPSPPAPAGEEWTEADMLELADERDALMDQVAAIARALGVPAEWSSENDLGALALEAARLRSSPAGRQRTTGTTCPSCGAGITVETRGGYVTDVIEHEPAPDPGGITVYVRPAHLDLLDKGLGANVYGDQFDDLVPMRLVPMEGGSE